MPQQRDNMILKMLSQRDYAELQRRMTEVTLPRGTVLYEAGQPIEYVYFPRTALVSLVGMTAEGQGTELAMVGYEGFVGVPVVLGALGAMNLPYEATIQVGGTLWKLPKDSVERNNLNHSPLSDTLLRYATLRMAQIAQSSICNRFHSVNQRLARWLLTAGDRVGANEFNLTQEFLAQMIGAQRPTVAELLGELRKAGVLAGQGGQIIIRDRPRLEATACECYDSVKQQLQAFAERS
jgi:CRP-like cAMP-binding protein